MRIGVPKEIKNHEYRIGVTPAGAHVLVTAGHVTHRELAADVGRPYLPAMEALA